MTSIFASALNYVQEREEPVDFLDIFFDYEKSKDEMGISEDIQQFKQQKKIYLSPLKQKNLNNTSINNSSVNVSVGQDYFGGRSNSVFYTSQNHRIKNNHSNNNNYNNNNINNTNTLNNNKQQKVSKLSPIQIENLHSSPKQRAGGGLLGNNQGQGLQSLKNLKNSLGATNAVKGQQQYAMTTSSQSNSQREYSRSQQFQIRKSDSDTANGERGNLDEMYRSALFQNNLNRHRLQQIEFYPSPPPKLLSNHHNHQQNQSVHQESHQYQQDSLQLNDYKTMDNPYSLKNGNSILKEHFNLQISSVPDPRKKWVLRKVNKPNNNNNNILSSTGYNNNAKKEIIKQNKNNPFLMSTQNDEQQTAYDQIQQANYSAKEQILFQSLKPHYQSQKQSQNSNSLNQQQQQNNNPLFLSQTIPTMSNYQNNQLINLNNLMISVNTPTFFFTQQQFFQQNNFPKTAPSSDMHNGNSNSRKERGFQIKKFQNGNSERLNQNNNNNFGNKPSTSQSSSTQQFKQDYRYHNFSKEQHSQQQQSQPMNNFFSSQKKNAAFKSEGDFKIDENIHGNPTITATSSQQNIKRSQNKSIHRDLNSNNNINNTKNQNSFYQLGGSINGSGSINYNYSIPSYSSSIDPNSKTLPIYCLNFNKTLEKRLLLNSLGI